MITTPSGLQYDDTHHGEGEVAQAGHHVTVHCPTSASVRQIGVLD
jgi:FKBP-type peptidyl-prolyl cis-trans isomerase